MWENLQINRMLSDHLPDISGRRIILLTEASQTEAQQIGLRELWYTGAIKFQSLGMGYEPFPHSGFLA